MRPNRVELAVFFLVKGNGLSKKRKMKTKKNSGWIDKKNMSENENEFPSMIIQHFFP